MGALVISKEINDFIDKNRDNLKPKISTKNSTNNKPTNPTDNNKEKRKIRNTRRSLRKKLINNNTNKSNILNKIQNEESNVKENKEPEIKENKEPKQKLNKNDKNDIKNEKLETKIKTVYKDISIMEWAEKNEIARKYKECFSSMTEKEIHEFREENFFSKIQLKPPQIREVLVAVDQ